LTKFIKCHIFHFKIIILYKIIKDFVLIKILLEVFMKKIEKVFLFCATTCPPGEGTSVFDDDDAIVVTSKGILYDLYSNIGNRLVFFYP